MSFAPQAPATYQDPGMSAASQQQEQQQQQQQYALTSSSAACHQLLPEALQRFSLVGKVAVVTGFVPLPYLLFPRLPLPPACAWLDWVRLGCKWGSFAHLEVFYPFSGARGLGYNMAEALCQVGCKAIAIMDVLQEQGDEAAETFNKKYNIAAAFYKVDVREEQAVRDVIQSV